MLRAYVNASYTYREIQHNDFPSQHWLQWREWGTLNWLIGLFQFSFIAPIRPFCTYIDE